MYYAIIIVTNLACVRIYKHSKELQIMEKYGVETTADKTASSVTRCPKCGSVAESHGWVHKCPQHGTEAFEDEVSRTEERSGQLDHSSQSSND